MNTAGTSIIRSLYIDNNSRNPKARGTLQFINNVVYNWVVSGYILGDTSGRSDGVMLGNYLITGPETRGGTLDSPTSAYHLYADGNHYDSDKDGALDGRLLGKGDFGTVTWLDAPSVDFPDVPAMTAQEAYAYVSVWDRHAAMTSRRAARARGMAVARLERSRARPRWPSMSLLDGPSASLSVNGAIATIDMAP